MAALLLLAPLLLLGTASGQADTDTQGCPQLQNTTEGNFSVETTPGTYQPNTPYVVTIKDDRNHSSGQFLLQAVLPPNASVGQWDKADTVNCSSVLTARLNITERNASWTSPAGDQSPVHIRVYLSLPNKTTELKTWPLNRGAKPTPVPSNTTSRSTTSSTSRSTSRTTSRSTSRTTPNSVGRAQGSSWLPAALLLLLLTASLLS